MKSVYSRIALASAVTVAAAVGYLSAPSSADVAEEEIMETDVRCIAEHYQNPDGYTHQIGDLMFDIIIGHWVDENLGCESFGVLGITFERAGDCNSNPGSGGTNMMSCEFSQERGAKRIIRKPEIESAGVNTECVATVEGQDYDFQPRYIHSCAARWDIG